MKMDATRVNNKIVTHANVSNVSSGGDTAFIHFNNRILRGMCFADMKRAL
jgi:hypothetical protein